MKSSQRRRARYSTEALVLRRSPLGESDWLVWLLSRDLGVIRAVAPAARRSKRRFLGCLELFARIEVTVQDSGADRLARLEEATLICGQVGIQKSLVSIAQASCLVELATCLLPERAPAPEAFDLVQARLKRLGCAPLASYELRAFELSMLAQSGLAPDLEHCGCCGVAESPAWVFDFGRGCLVCAACPVSVHTKRLDKAVVDYLRGVGRNPPPAAVLEAPALVAARARELLEQVLSCHIDRPMPARAFLRDLALAESGPRPGKPL